MVVGGGAAAAGAGTLLAAGAAVMFWRAMLARASMMALGASAGFFSAKPGRPGPGGGLPVGVVDWSGVVCKYGTRSSRGAGHLLEALIFCLNCSIRAEGNVWPFSQMSMSFLILSYCGSVLLI